MERFIDKKKVDISETVYDIQYEKHDCIAHGNN